MKLGTLDTQMLGLRGLVLEGRAVPVLPTTDSGWKTYGQGRLFLPAATNYCVNPRFVDDLSGWSNKTPSRCNLERMIGDVPIGDTYGRMTVVSSEVGAKQIRSVSVTCNAGDVLTGSIYLRGTTGVTVTVYVTNFYGAAGGKSLACTLTSTWTRIVITTDPVSVVDSAKFLIQIEMASTTIGTYCDMVCADLEKSPILTPYFDGSYPDCAWTGAANASTSTRTVSSLIFTDIATINSGGVTPAGAKVAYGRNAATGYYGPVVVAESAYSAGEQAVLAANWPNWRALYDVLHVGDHLIPLNGDSIAYRKVA